MKSTEGQKLASRQSVVYCSHCKVFKAYVTEDSIKKFKSAHKGHFVYVASEKHEKNVVLSFRSSNMPASPLKPVTFK